MLSIGDKYRQYRQNTGYRLRPEYGTSYCISDNNRHKFTAPFHSLPPIHPPLFPPPILRPNLPRRYKDPRPSRPGWYFFLLSFNYLVLYINSRLSFKTRPSVSHSFQSLFTNYFHILSSLKKPTKPYLDGII